MLFDGCRRAARTSAYDLILLEDQDRSLWKCDQMAEGIALVEQALHSRRFGPYTIQAAIAAWHSEALHAASTDGAEIVELYHALMRAHPSPVIELNRAVAVAVRDEPTLGFALVDAILYRGDLPDYRLAQAARADFRPGVSGGRRRLASPTNRR